MVRRIARHFDDIPKHRGNEVIHKPYFTETISVFKRVTSHYSDAKKVIYVIQLRLFDSSLDA